MLKQLLLVKGLKKLSEAVKPENIVEFWFLNHYRVLAIATSKDYVVLSVDVYRKNWLFSDYESVCVAGEEYCLLYKILAPDTSKHVLSKGVVEKIVVTGVKAGSVYETVNVRWFIRGSVELGEVEKIFYWSWELVGCMGPRNTPWYHGCSES